MNDLTGCFDCTAWTAHDTFPCQVQRCLASMPALLVLDDLDVVCPATAGDGADPPPGSTAARGTTAWLVGVMDELRALRLPGIKDGVHCRCIQPLSLSLALSVYTTTVAVTVTGVGAHCIQPQCTVAS